MSKKIHAGENGATGSPVDASARSPASTATKRLVEREAAVLASERAAHLREKVIGRREEIADRREEVADRREEVVDWREEATTLREKALRAQEEAARAKAELIAHNEAQLREANEKLVVATVRAQTMAEAAEEATARMSHMAEHDFLTRTAGWTAGCSPPWTATAVPGGTWAASPGA